MEWDVKYKPQNTLSYYLSAPQTRAVKMTHLPIKVLGESAKKYHETCDHATPDHEAIRFYTLNHLASVVKQNFTLNEPLPAWAQQVMERYNTELTQQAKRAFVYLLLITTREARHMYGHKVGDTFYAKLEQEYGKPLLDFAKNLPQGEDHAVKMLENNPPDCTVGQYVGGLAYIFYKGKWASSYGGPKWGNVTDCLLHCVEGKTSMEMMLDTCYTLAHNGGPIFNKGMMYGHYSGQFIKVLDIQRSGQMPELVLDTEKYGIDVPADLKPFVNLVAKEYPEQFGTYVDWYKVDSLGGKGSYQNEKIKQDKKHPKKKEPLVLPGGQVWNMQETGDTWDTGLGDELPIMVRVA